MHISKSIFYCWQMEDNEADDIVLPYLLSTRVSPSFLHWKSVFRMIFNQQSGRSE